MVSIIPISCTVMKNLSNGSYLYSSKKLFLNVFGLIFPLWKKEYRIFTTGFHKISGTINIARDIHSHFFCFDSISIKFLLGKTVSTRKIIHF